MITDNSLITGERNPMVGGTYTYTLRLPHITERWEIWRNNQCLVKKDEGEFSFLDASLGESFVITVYFRVKENPSIEQRASIGVKVFPGDPKFLEISWQDTNLEDINGRGVAYLDDIYLSVRTANIPKGDRLIVQIIDMASSEGPKMYAYVDEHSIARFKVSPELLRFLAENSSSGVSIYNRIHYYRAKISYFREEIPVGKEKKYIEIKETTEILCVTNVAGQAIPPKNGVKPVKVENDNINNKDKKPVKIKLNVFFDGTKNNRTNVKLVEDAKTEEEKNKIIKKYGEDSSYDQGYSNVAIMQWSDDFQKSKKEISIYIEGVGTRDLHGDVTFFGLALALGSTGLKAKVEKALNQILEERKGVVKENEVVSEVKVNVVGFSRGAASARHFVSTKRSEIALQLTTSKINVIFTFVGLFDTVSAHGLDHHDTAELSLNMGSKALKVLQLKALDEHRANFSLTDISSSIEAGVGYEFGLPGAHSDIGGGFKDNSPEKINIILADRLIKEGWYTEEDKKKKTTDPASVMNVSTPYGSVPAKIPAQSYLHRTVFNAYQYIPLKIMENFGVRYGKMRFTDSKLNKYYSKIPPELFYYRDKFVQEADEKNGAHSKEIEELKETKRNELRHNYLHLTAFEESGQESIKKLIANSGRYTNGLPDREIIPG